MTQTLEPDAPAEPSAARRRAEAWLADFEAALAAGDADRAAGLFAPTSFWRDLIAFTWNITTVENRDGVADLVRNTDAGATNFRVTEGEEPAEADGKSVMQMIILAAEAGTPLRIDAEGDDAEAAVAKLAELFERKFDEE